MIIIAGVILLGAVGQIRADTPGSNTTEPVVCTRILSDALDPRNRRSSCVVAPVESSEITVFEYVPKPKNWIGDTTEFTPTNIFDVIRLLV